MASLRSDKCSDRRAKLKGSPLPIVLMEEKNLLPGGRKRQALIFTQGPSRWGAAPTPTQVWVLAPSDLGDIEDAAEWGRRDGTAFSETQSFVETQLVGGLCCCRRSRRRGHRTSSGSSYLHQQYAMSGEMFCGHSACCTSDVALRTFTGPQCESGTSRSSSAGFRTKGPQVGGLQRVAREYKTGQPEAKRSLRFLSLSGCYQVTDLGLR